MTGQIVATVLVGLLTLSGVIYAARGGNRVARYSAESDRFEKITTKLEKQNERQEERIVALEDRARTDRMTLREAIVYVQALLHLLRQHSIETPPVPQRLIDASIEGFDT